MTRKAQTIILAAALTLGAGFAHAAFDSFDAAFKSARDKANSNSLGAAVADLDAAFALAGTPQQKIKALNAKADHLAKDGKSGEAGAVWEQIYAMPDAAPADRYRAMNLLGDFLAKEKKHEEARRAFAKAAAVESVAPSARVRALLSSAKTLVMEKKHGDAQSAFTAALAVPGMGASDRFDIYDSMIKASQEAKASAEAMATMDRALADTNLPSANRVVLIRRKAAQLFDDWKIKEAHEVIDAAMRKEGISKPEWVDLMRAQAGLYVNEGKYPQAVAIYDSLVKDPECYFDARLQAMNAAADLLKADRKGDEAVKRCEWLRDNAGSIAPDTQSAILRSLATACASARQYDKARAAAVEAFSLPGISNNSTNSGRDILIGISRDAEDIEQMRKDYDQYVIGNEKTSAAARKAAMLELATIYLDRFDYKTAVPYLEMLVKDGAELPLPREHRDKFFVSGFRALRTSGKAGVAKAFLDGFIANGTVSATDRASYVLFGRISPDGPAVDASTVKTLSDGLLKDLDAKGKADALATVGRILVALGETDRARAVLAVRDGLFAKPQCNQLVVRFVDNAPKDVGSWLASDIIRSPKNRADVTCEYGAAEAAELVTDVMSKGRNVGDPTVQADKETYFYMVCDDRVLSLFFVGVDSRIKDVLNKVVGASGYEMYLAAGEDGPSYQWIFDPSRDRFDSMAPWNSPHRYYRNLGEFVTLQSLPLTNGYATCMTFSWEVAYDRLPKNGDTWPFELIRWTRGGGVTWGGKQVYERGAWGRIKFEISDKQLLEIRRAIVYQSWARYRKEKQPSTGGLVGIWKDQELGDPAFFDAKLKDLVARLDECGKLVTDDMTPETVDKLYLEAVPDWFDFRYTVAALRQEYLAKQLLDVRSQGPGR